MARKTAMSIREIAEETGLTPSAVSMCLTRGLRKLRRDGLLLTCKELAEVLKANRSTEHSVRRTAVRGR